MGLVKIDLKQHPDFLDNLQEQCREWMHKHYHLTDDRGFNLAGTSMQPKEFTKAFLHYYGVTPVLVMGEPRTIIHIKDADYMWFRLKWLL